MVLPAYKAVAQALNRESPAVALEVLPQVDSTNSELMRRFRAGDASALLLVAEHQTAGRGRLGRQWVSGSGSAAASLTFSLALPLAPADWSGLSLAVGVSLADALHPDLRVKWPNDLWLAQRKLAGVLIETAQFGSQRQVIIGVGINLRAPDGSGLARPPAGLAECLPGIDAPTALLRVAAPLVRAVRRFEREGFAPFHSAFQRRDVLAGQPVTLSDGFCGIAQGVSAQGELLLQSGPSVRVVRSDEVSLRPPASAPLGAA
ncbi:MAG: biotin--[acetyl-CoA-carboxylase] ligase [Rhodoferax sp.]|nr:biotin--[acetyl-CoA-carboxylase] ligase [Rhodoferax sp.]